MNVEEFLAELYNDELSDLFAGNRNARIESRPKLLPLMNTGMLYAYSKHKIKYDTTQLTVVSTQDTYLLPETDILSIDAVYNSYGRELDATEMQILGQEIRFFEPQDVELQVSYKVKPTKFVLTQVDTAVVVDLPELLLCWLRAYVAARYLAPMKTEEAMAKAQDFMGQAQMHEQLYISTNPSHEYSSRSNERLTSRGFA